MDPHEPISAQQAPGLSPQRWQADRRSACHRGRPAIERRSGVDSRRQPRMPPQARPIYPD